MKSAPVDLDRFIRDVPDFPKPGIIFKDITPLLASPVALSAAVEGLAAPFRDAGITRVAAIESRGFIFGAPVAQLLGCGFVPIRKPGKLPCKTVRHEYALEYGSDCIEVHDDALSESDRVLIVDDVLATGGTAAAAVHLVEHFGASVAGVSLVVELKFLGGRSKLGRVPVHTLLAYD